MMNRINCITLAVCLGFIPQIQAQEQENPDSLTGETVIIVKEFEPVIKNGKKINHQPSLQTVSHEQPDFSYTVTPVNTPNNFTPDTIQAAKIKGEPLHDLYRAYVKAGLGNYTNNLAQLRLNSVRSRDFQWGLNADHFMSNGGINDLPYNGFLHENVDVYAKKMLKRHIVVAGGNFAYDEVYKYGFPHPNNALVEISQDATRNKYTYYEGYGGISSMINDSSRLNYVINARYHHLTLNNGLGVENNLLIHSEFSKFYGSEKSIAGLDIDYNGFKNTLNTTNTLIKPNIDVRFNGEKWRLSAGFKIGIDAGETTRFHFYPNAEFKYNVVQNFIVPYIGVTGGLNRNSLESIRQTNPFITHEITLKNSSTSYDAYFGVRGVYSSQISYNIRGGYKRVKNMVLYTQAPEDFLIQPPLLTNAYIPLYDTVGIANISAQLNYDTGEKWKIMWRLQYNQYETQNAPVAWNMPEFTTDITAHYSLQKKIVATGSVFFGGSRYKQTDDINQERLAEGIYGEKLAPYIDLNLGLEYRFTPRGSVFVNVNNILSQNYELWGNYPVQGINVLGGFTYAFWKK